MKKQAPRLFAEALVIFTSVIMALVADDWRTDRDDRLAEAESLASMVRDLEADANAQRVFKAEMEAQAEALTRLIGFLEDRSGQDSVLTVIDDALSVWNYRPSHPTYQSLVGSGELRLVDDPSLRDAVTLYHEDDVSYLDDLRAAMRQRSDRADELLGPHIRRERAYGGVWEVQRVYLLDELAVDREVINALAASAASRSWLATRIERIFLPENEELRSQIEAYLNNGG